MKADGRKDPPYIPLKRPPSRTAIVFDLGYDLLLASEREARRQLLAPWAILPLAFLKKLGPEKFVDPYVARELHLQEVRDKELRDLLDALLGKASDWRSAMCIEARHNDYARSELGSIMGSSYAKADIGEAVRFIEALKAVDILKKGGPVKTAKAWALLFTLGSRVKGELLPTRGEILDFLKRNGIKVRPGNAGRDIFTGPILGGLQQRRSGRSKETRQLQKFDEFES